VDHGNGVTGYRLDLGTTQGGNNLHAGVESAAQSEYATGLPVDGSTVWVRLSSRIAGVLQSLDYSFTSYTTPPPPSASVPLTARVAGIAEGNTGVTTQPFDTAAGDLLVAFVSSSGPDLGQEVAFVNGAGLTWTLLQRENTQKGDSEIWTATSATALTGVAVNAGLTASTRDLALTVVAFSGAGGVGASTKANGAVGAPTVSLTTTKAGSLVWGVGNDFNGAVPRALPANQVMVHETLGPNGDTFWVQRLSTPTSSAGVLVTVSEPRRSTTRGTSRPSRSSQAPPLRRSRRRQLHGRRRPTSRRAPRSASRS
jgi:hypothetical protein